ncbi:hypothetical protein C8Q75DRAFT_802044 [Abortiporus biennis]|nr:hypothetical protein C8Q75DRAFT_802044 [Abortiporus biennis]
MSYPVLMSVAPVELPVSPGPYLCSPPSFIVADPFDNPADVILRTIDNHDFHVFKNILSIASPFFRDMFSLTQPALKEDDAGPSPIIDVPESAATLDHLLRFLYPVVDPRMDKLSTIEDVLQAADKYEMSAAIEDLKRPLRKLRKGQPLQVFAIACRFNLEDIARDAAIFWRDRKARSKGVAITEYHTSWDSNPAGESYVPEMAHISAGSYLRLVNYVRTGVMTTFCHSSYPPPPNRSNEPIDPCLSSVKHDIIVRSSDDVDFQANRLILTLVSKVLDEKILNLLSSQSSSPNASLEDQTLPVLQVDEPATTLNILLRLCYPTNRPSLDCIELDVLTEVFGASVKYEITPAVEACKACLSKLARNAAIRMTPMVLENQIIPEFERTNAEVLYALFKFQHEYRRALCNISSETDKQDIYSTIINAQWVWHEDNSDIHPELIYTAVAEGTIQRGNRYNYSNKSYAMSSQLSGMENLKNQMRRILNQVPLNLPWLSSTRKFKSNNRRGRKQELEEY